MSARRPHWGPKPRTPGVASWDRPRRSGLEGGELLTKRGRRHRNRRPERTSESLGRRTRTGTGRPRAAERWNPPRPVPELRPRPEPQKGGAPDGGERGGGARRGRGAGRGAGGMSPWVGVERALTGCVRVAGHVTHPLCACLNLQARKLAKDPSDVKASGGHSSVVYEKA